jgi:excisionase family DNA binding protein
MTARIAYSLAEAAQLSSLSVRSLRYLMATGKLGFAKVGSRVLITHTELERFLRRTSVKSTDILDVDESIRPPIQGRSGCGNALAEGRDVVLEEEGNPCA